MPTRFKQIPQMTLFEAAPQIRQAMREGNTEEAVRLFLRTGEKESLSLFEKFSESQQQYEHERIGLEEWGRVQAQICQHILGTDSMRETEMSENPSPELKAKILQLLHERKTEQALVRFEGFGDQYLLLQAQLNTAQNQSCKGLLESEYFEATKSKMNYTLQELMGQTTEPIHKGGLLDKILSWFK